MTNYTRPTELRKGEGCLPDATTAPLDDWRYRFGPLQEREQKRQYATSQNQALTGLMWTYTLLGADAKQLASYNGIQGAFCGQQANTLWMWPVEYNSYGPAQTRIITRPQGAKEYVIADHLGSTRLTLNQTGDILERLDYQPFGKEINEAGDGARTSYIGREKDNESELGFYGVRMYEPEYGRFMSVDALWGKYAAMQPYQYAGNSPISLSDPSGLEWYDIDGQGTWEFHPDTPTKLLPRENEDGEVVLTEVAGQSELLTFDGENLSWLREDGSMMSWEAVSGQLMNEKTQQNLQDVADVGPIPEGDYRVDLGSTVQRSNMGLFDQIHYKQSAWGNYFVNIKPYSGPLGRSGFNIHGGETPGSAGCIDLHKNNDRFFGMMLSRGVGLIPLTVRYRK